MPIEVVHTFFKRLSLISEPPAALPDWGTEEEEGEESVKGKGREYLGTTRNFLCLNRLVIGWGGNMKSDQYFLHPGPTYTVQL